VAALSSIVLGGVRAVTLREAGLITADESAVRSLESLFASTRAPYLSLWY
jgi:hypothetical protein